MSGGGGARVRNAVAADAALAAALLALDPFALGGARIRCMPGAVRQGWLDALTALLPDGAPWCKVPLNVSDERLLGGLDLAATLRAGRPVAGRGLLAEASGGVLVLAMAERMSPAAAARVCAMLDCGEAVLERDGFARRHEARAGVVALDEGMEQDEQPPPGLLERLAFQLDLNALPASTPLPLPCGREALEDARRRLPGVGFDEGVVEALCATAVALGVASLRAPALALRAACAAAALAGRERVAEEDLAVAARLVLAPRATRLPAGPEDDAPAPREPEPTEQAAPTREARDSENDDSAEDDDSASRPPQDLVLEAARAAIPPALLAQLEVAAAMGRGAAAGGRSGALRQSARYGRPVGVRAAPMRAGARLNVVETLRAAAPWQALRRRERAAGGDASPRRRVHVRAGDFRITRFKERSETTTVFTVDASGSAAMHRLAEAKGAVELLLAECYVRRDRVALVAFRGEGAEVLLPPTRSLVRAKRSLARLPGGGGTPLANGIEAAMQLADGIRRRGDTVTVVLLTDGRANVGRDGASGRSQALEDALGAGRALRATGVRSLLLDTSPRPSAQAREVARAMGATYQPLPFAGAEVISRAARAASGSGR